MTAIPRSHVERALHALRGHVDSGMPVKWITLKVPPCGSVSTAIGPTGGIDDACQSDETCNRSRTDFEQDPESEVCGSKTTVSPAPCRVRYSFDSVVFFDRLAWYFARIIRLRQVTSQFHGLTPLGGTAPV